MENNNNNKNPTKNKQQQKNNGIRIWRDKTNTEKLGITKRTKSLKRHESGLASDQDIYSFLHFKDGHLMQIDR